MLQRRTALISIVALLAGLAGFVLSHRPDSGMTHLVMAWRDYLARQGRHTAPNPKLIFLAIDSESVSLDAEADLKELFEVEDKGSPEYQALQLMSQHWPWPRSVYALVVDRLVKAGAKSVVFDLTFQKPTDDDAAFRTALERYRDHVVIGSNFESSFRANGNGVDAVLTRPTEQLLPSSAERRDQVGYVNFWPDSDGVIRQAQFNTSFSQFLGSEKILDEEPYTALSAQAVKQFGKGDLVPTDTNPRLFRYTGGPLEGFPPHSIFEIFVPEYWKSNFASGQVFDGAIVVIGAAGNWQHDEHQTPFGMMPGPVLQLNAINALLHNEFVVPIGESYSLVIWIGVCLLAAITCIRVNHPVIRMSVAVVIGGAWLALQFPLYNRFAFLAPTVGPVFVLIVTGLFSLVYDLVRMGAEQLRLHLALVERKRAQEALELAKQDLERRVMERTAELTKTNVALTNLVEEKNVLLKEVHHRVKNNLQIISSLLSLQSNYIEDPAALQFFNESRNRVRSMALIHEKLYQSDDLAKVDFPDYLKTLTSGLQASFAQSASDVRMSLEVEPLMLGVDHAVPCGLIVNELVTNCFKYAFRDRAGEIRVSMKRSPDSRLHLSVSDNGVGFPKDIDIRNTESLGMQLVTTLTDQLEGTLELRNGVGTTFEISFTEAH